MAESAKSEGILVSWDDGRGFGFAESPDAPVPVFVHAKFLRSRQTRPAPGDRLSFALTKGRDGGPAASDVEVLGAPPPAPVAQRTPGETFIDVSRLLAGVAILAGAAAVAALDRAPDWFAWLYVMMTVGSGLAYWMDKAYARAGRSRVRETSLHLADAFFGIAGGLFAQHVFRHKTRKKSFRYITRLIFLLHATLLILLVSGAMPFEALIPGAWSTPSR